MKILLEIIPRENLASRGSFLIDEYLLDRLEIAVAVEVVGLKVGRLGPLIPGVNGDKRGGEVMRINVILSRPYDNSCDILLLRRRCRGA